MLGFVDRTNKIRSQPLDSNGSSFHYYCSVTMPSFSSHVYIYKAHNTHRRAIPSTTSPTQSCPTSQLRARQVPLKLLIKKRHIRASPIRIRQRQLGQSGLSSSRPYRRQRRYVHSSCSGRIDYRDVKPVSDSCSAPNSSVSIPDRTVVHRAQYGQARIPD